MIYVYGIRSGMHDGNARHQFVWRCFFLFLRKKSMEKKRKNITIRMLLYLCAMIVYSPHFHWKWEQMLLCMLTIRLQILCQSVHVPSGTYIFYYYTFWSFVFISMRLKTNKQIHLRQLYRVEQYEREICLKKKQSDKRACMRTRAQQIKNKFERWCGGFCLLYFMYVFFFLFSSCLFHA